MRQRQPGLGEIGGIVYLVQMADLGRQAGGRIG